MRNFRRGIMTFFSKQPATIKDNWIASWHLYRKAFSQTWLLGIIIGVLLAISTSVPMVFNKIYGSADSTAAKIASFVSSVVVVLFMVYLIALMLYKIYNVGHKQHMSWHELRKIINGKYMRIFTAMLIMFVIYFIGMILLVFPGIFAFVLLSMVEPLILFNNQKVWAALNGSLKLVWGNWWRTFAVIFPLVIVNFWAGYIVSSSINQKWYFMILGNTIVATIFYPLFYSCVLVMFNDLKLRKDLIK